MAKQEMGRDHMQVLRQLHVVDRKMNDKIGQPTAGSSAESQKSNTLYPNLSGRSESLYDVG